jgi:hypothetical protein
MRCPFHRELVHQTTCALFFRHCTFYLPVEQFEQNCHYLLVVPTYGARLELGVNFQANFLSYLVSLILTSISTAITFQLCTL